MSMTKSSILSFWAQKYHWVRLHAQEHSITVSFWVTMSQDEANCI